MVVLNDTVLAARGARKTDAGNPATFQSPGSGPLGRVDESRVMFHAPPRRTAPLPLPPILDKPVALLKVCMDDDGRLARRIPEMGYAGVVLEGAGVGHLPAWYGGIVDDLAANMPVVLSSRVSSGPVYTRTYGFAGSEMDSMARGVIPGGDLGAAKCRVLLTLLLAGGIGGEDLRREFALRA
jgi:L-asparaginase